jgi:hypothetical protein
MIDQSSEGKRTDIAASNLDQIAPSLQNDTATQNGQKSKSEWLVGIV